MSDARWHDLLPVQSKQNTPPPTIASAATIAPTNFLCFISGTTQITTITPPVTGAHMLVLIFTNANPGGVGNSGNINNTLDVAQYAPLLLFYDPVGAKYYSGVLALE
jgi:hypothetical protein